jgi:hypothetical protein
MKRWQVAGAGAMGLVLAIALWPCAERAGAAAANAEQVRSLASFDRVETNGVFAMTIRAGRAQHVTISGDPQIVERVTTEVTHGTLAVGMRPGTNLLGSVPHVAIDVPKLHGFANSGAGTITISGVAGGALALQNAGAAKIAAAGTAGTLAIELDGVGMIDTTALDAHDVTVDNNGVGRVDVRASGDLTMNVNGVGEIRYTGSPTNVDQHINGLGRIRRR